VADFQKKMNAMCELMFVIIVLVNVAAMLLVPAASAGGD
jgi:hypothetical protein